MLYDINIYYEVTYSQHFCRSSLFFRVTMVISSLWYQYSVHKEAFNVLLNVYNGW